MTEQHTVPPTGTAPDAPARWRPRRQVSHTVDLAAPPERVWDAITATSDRRSAWDPLIVEFERPDAGAASGPVAVGERLRIRVALPGRSPMRFRPRVTASERGVVLEWLGHLGVRGVFDGRHRFELHPLPDGGTRLVHQESFTGVLVPALWRSLQAPTIAGFEAFDAALADHVADDPADQR